MDSATPQIISTKTELLQRMAQGAIVITPNNRLTLQLLRDYAIFRDKTVIAKPQCFAYQGFLQHCYQVLCHQQAAIEHPVLLTSQQVRYLWQQVLTEQNGTVNQGLLHEVMDSWTRCELWQTPNNHPLFASTAQTRLFQQWWQNFAHKLGQLKAIAVEQLAPYLIKHNYTAPPALIWLCFDDYTPQQQDLMAYLTMAGCQQYIGDFIKPGNNTVVYEAADAEDEYQQLVQWLLAKLQAGHKRIGVVVPDLQQQAKRIQRLLQQHLPPQSFNVSLGNALADYPLVAQALCWLTLDKQQLDFHQACLLLRSPFIGHAEQEFLSRGQMLQDSPCLQERVILFSAFSKELKQYAPLLAECLANLNTYPANASITEWVNHFHLRLKILGFPGSTPLKSAAYQCYQRFLLLFEEFRHYALLTPALEKEQALQTFIDLAKTTVFQAQAPAAPIHILGLLESAGIAFDCLWITGLTDQCLPQKTRLSAFIPLSLQQQLVMPYADPARELLLAQKTLARLESAAAEGILSYAHLTKDSPNLPSPLLLHHPRIKMEKAVSELVKKSPLLAFNENYNLPVLPQETIRGGTRLLANQAQCPFRAFAAHRLHAKTAKSLGDGPDASERGQIIHRAMELIWRTIGDQSTLLTLTAIELDTIIEEAIKKTLAPYAFAHSHSFTPLIQQVEMKRLKRLLKVALEWEKQRPPFAIRHLEETFTTQLAGMDFQVRIDRMDTLADNTTWVIDYKSSFPQSTPWKEDRPTEPQLLLYALLHDDINTILFTQLKNGQHQCKGLSEQDYAIAGIQTIKGSTWQEYRQQWQLTLHALAEEFQSGHCPPKPAKASTCQHCEFTSLCRYSVQED